MEVVLLFIRLFLFAVFALAGLGKILDPEGSEKAVRDFGVPENLARPLAFALPYIEIAIALSLLFVTTSWPAAIAALLLLLVFIGGMLVQMAKGNAPDCHCFGQLHSEPVGKASLIRNAVFALFALFLAVQGSDRQGAAIGETVSGILQSMLLLAVAAMSVIVVFLLKQMLDRQQQIMRRIDTLELISAEGIPVEREAAGHPQDGLPIGSPFPDFLLPNLNGKRRSFEELIALGRPMLFFFVSSTCEPCKALMPSIEEWQAELSGKVSIVLLSSGTADENKDKFPEVLADDILLQTNREIADLVRARWTPTALFVRADGTIASQLAAGDAAIRHLVDHIREADFSSPNVYFAETTQSGRPPKIGDTVKEFSLPDVNGGVITDKDLRNKRTVAVFWSRTCPHCTAMMADLKEWDASKNGSDPALVVFSDGEPEDHADAGLSSPILLDGGHKVATTLGMWGTPSAVIIDESGTIISETAVGSTNIWALLGKNK